MSITLPEIIDPNPYPYRVNPVAKPPKGHGDNRDLKGQLSRKGGKDNRPSIAGRGGRKSGSYPDSRGFNPHPRYSKGYELDELECNAISTKAAGVLRKASAPGTRQDRSDPRRSDSATPYIPSIKAVPGNGGGLEGVGSKLDVWL